MESFDDFTFQFPGELEDHSVIVSNLPMDITTTELHETASHFGLVESIELKGHNVVATVRFFDLRAAMTMRRDFRKVFPKGCMVQFAIPQPIKDRKHPPNNGTIVIFHLVEGISDAQLEGELKRFGEIRQIRSPPDRTTQRFVEFWDTRDAAVAVRGLRGKTILNSRISVEFSLPGGYRKNPEALQNARPPIVVRRTIAPCTIEY
jgi:RNA recognition motif-containing protein